MKLYTYNYPGAHILQDPGNTIDQFNYYEVKTVPISFPSQYKESDYHYVTKFVQWIFQEYINSLPFQKSSGGRVYNIYAAKIVIGSDTDVPTYVDQYKYSLNVIFSPTTTIALNTAIADLASIMGGSLSTISSTDYIIAKCPGYDPNVKWYTACLDISTTPVAGDIYISIDSRGQKTEYAYIGTDHVIFGASKVFNYVVSFGNESGYNTPNDFIGTLNGNTDLVGVYYTGPALGRLRVYTESDTEPIFPGGAIYLTGPGYSHELIGTGTAVVDIPAGSYTLSFGPVYEHETPADIPVTVTEGGDIPITAVYISTWPDGRLIVTTNVATAPIYLNGDLAGYGSIDQIVPAMNYWITFGDVDGYITPDAINVSVHDSETVTREAVYVEIYTPPNPAVLTVNTTPVVGQIFIDGSSVGSGSVTLELDPGTYIISFGVVSGYMTPDNISVTLGEGAIATRTGIYTEIIIPPQYCCPVCGLCFDTQAELDAHMATHEEPPEPTFCCPICGACFYTQAELDAHMLTHEEEPPPDEEEGANIWKYATLAGLAGLGLIILSGRGSKNGR